MSRLFRDVDGGALFPHGSVVCIGAFDGLHLGHRALVRHAVARARDLSLPAVALSFEPLPREFFSRELPPPRLTLARGKYQGLRELGADAIELDVADTASVSGLAWRIDGAAFDVVIVNAGVYGPRTRGLEPPSDTDFDTVMHTNVLGPMRVAAQLGEALAPGAKLAVLSSSLASIGARTGPGGWLYRASKAATNSVLGF